MNLTPWCKLGSQVTFDTLNTPNLNYQISVSASVGSSRVVYEVDGTGAILAVTQTSYSFQQLLGMPLKFTTVVGNVIAECYTVAGGLIATGGGVAGVRTKLSVLFNPVGRPGCGSRPEKPEPFTITWERVGMSVTALELACQMDYFQSDGTRCDVVLAEEVAGKYQLKVELAGVLIGCGAGYSTCRNPFIVDIVPDAPTAVDSAFRIPSTYILGAGRDTRDEFDTVLVLQDRYGNKVGG
jgi:hypothetical protein